MQVLSLQREHPQFWTRMHGAEMVILKKRDKRNTTLFICHGFYRYKISIWLEKLPYERSDGNYWSTCIHEVGSRHCYPNNAKDFRAASEKPMLQI